jgi:hypothetical protein
MSKYHIMKIALELADAAIEHEVAARRWLECLNRVPGDSILGDHLREKAAARRELEEALGAAIDEFARGED